MDILETDAFYRRQRRNMSCGLIFSLLPFFLATALYFHLQTPDSPIITAGVKAAPALLLAAVLLSRNGVQSIAGVAGGLVCSAVGDCCLVWQGLFFHGMCAFGVAHLFYSLSFISSRYATHSSSTRTNLLCLLMVGAGAAAYMYLYPFLQRDPDAKLLTPAVGVYTALVTLMGVLAFRSCSAATRLGGLSFIFSDFALALQVFHITDLQGRGHTTVMVSYYLAQLLIAVGDVWAAESKDDFPKWKRS